MTCSNTKGEDIMYQIERLSQLIREKNLINNKIAAITGRPALTGHTGEYIASVIFNIQRKIVYLPDMTVNCKIY